MAVDSVTDYRDAWRRYRLLRGAAFTGLILVLALPMVVPSLFPSHWRDGHPMLFDALAFVPGLYIWGVTQRWLLHWKCPRCGRHYAGDKHPSASDSFRATYFGHCCVYCGLSRYATGPMAEMDLPQGSGPSSAS